MSGFPPLSLSGGSASSGSSTGDVYLPAELFSFPEYPAALAANQQYGGSGASFNINPVTVAVIVAGVFALKKWGK